jgi:hypothetical protein
MALALTPLAHDMRAGKHGLQRGAVGGIIVVDVDRSIGQRRPETLHDSADCRGFIIAGEQDGNIQIIGTRSGHDSTRYT